MFLTTRRIYKSSDQKNVDRFVIQEEISISVGRVIGIEVKNFKKMFAKWMKTERVIMSAVGAVILSLCSSHLFASDKHKTDSFLCIADRRASR
jgi:hypothetical protein